MTKKFNTKTYQGKARVYTAIPRAPRVSRLWAWNEDAKEYQTPDRGNIYYAAKYATDPEGNRKRVYESFATLEEAREWQAEDAPALLVKATPTEDKGDGVSVREVVGEWRKRRLSQLAHGTQIQYEKILRLHFGSLMNLNINEISPKRVDLWIDDLKAWNLGSNRRKARLSFDHELSLLSTILRYYLNYHDDTDFQFPIKPRHRDAMWVTKQKSAKPKDVSEEEFLKFRGTLLEFQHGHLLAGLATVQYFQALRISEAAGLFWEDIHLDWKTPQNSRLKIIRSVCYPHQTGLEAYIKLGFKNSAANGGIKEQPMFPESFAALAECYRGDRKGLIFGIEDKPIRYPVIESSYNRAFKKAGLPYRGTHVMRHGGCRRVFNEAGELPVAQQILGNADLKTTLVYAKRQASALTNVAHKHWERRFANVTLLANACKSEEQL